MKLPNSVILSEAKDLAAWAARSFASLRACPRAKRRDDRASLLAALGATQAHGRLQLTPIGMCEAGAYSKNTYLFAQSRVLAACCGEKKAMVAIDTAFS